MDKALAERAVVSSCSALQAICLAILLHSIMSNMPGDGIGYKIGFGCGIAVGVAFFNLTVCTVFGGNETIVRICRVLCLVPLLILMSLFVIGGVQPG